jgi:hypothetical protein
MFPELQAGEMSSWIKVVFLSWTKNAPVEQYDAIHVAELESRHWIPAI